MKYKNKHIDILYQHSKIPYTGKEHPAGSYLSQETLKMITRPTIQSWYNQKVWWDLVMLSQGVLINSLVKSWDSENYTNMMRQKNTGNQFQNIVK